MPRPKPAIELKPRSIRLTDTDWAKLQSIGGVQWLRVSLRKSRASTIYRTERNKQMRLAYAAGASVAELVLQFKINRVTAWRIVA